MHAVPLNGGDEALLRATIATLQTRWPGVAISVLCMDPVRTRQWMADVSFDADLEHAPNSVTTLADRCLRRMNQWCRTGLRPGRLRRWADRRTAVGERKRILAKMQECDLVLSSAGGFFHDFYPIEDRLYALEMALDIGKPVILLAQSIGPFWKAGSIHRIREVFGRVSEICVRDACSIRYLDACGVDVGRVTRTADVAFLWRRLRPDLFRHRRVATNRIGLCFREWPLGDSAGSQLMVTKAVALCTWLLKGTTTLHFISTCQGIEDYVDDSEWALNIIEALPATLRSRCTVERRRLSPDELICELGRLDAFIGMRLHACLLAMLAGTPAMGLGYESKTSEIYSQMGLSGYQVESSAQASDWIQCAELFMLDAGDIHEKLPGILERQAGLAMRNLDAVARHAPWEHVRA